MEEGEDEEIDILGISDDEADALVKSQANTAGKPDWHISSGANVPKTTIIEANSGPSHPPAKRIKSGPSRAQKSTKKTAVTDDEKSLRKLDALKAQGKAILTASSDLRAEVNFLESRHRSEVETKHQDPSKQSAELIQGNIETADDKIEQQEEEFIPPTYSVPICADVLTFDFAKLGETNQFDVILMDPPWQLTSSNPSRGVVLGYHQLPDSAIEALPLHLLQTDGFLFLWVINSKYTKAFELFEKWGYTYVRLTS
ncbi:hypothetical protein HDU97_001490 [Phlyctochytrium planicorne]|nr:hypothetical protein HDU97_001490 [Phlyctochytrium planicorne]